jgi:hypothetical protein
MTECEIKYKIYDLTEDAAIGPEEGETLYRQLRTALDAGQSVELDFEGVVLTAPPFLGLAIGNLYEHYSSDYLERHLTFSNLLPFVEQVITSVKERSALYYSYDKATQAAVNKALAKYFEEED